LNQIRKEFNLVWDNPGVPVDVLELSAKSRGMDVETFKDQPKDIQRSLIRITKSHFPLIYKMAIKQGGIILPVKENGGINTHLIRLAPGDEGKVRSWFYKKEKLITGGVDRIMKYLEIAIKEEIDIKQIKSNLPLLLSEILKKLDSGEQEKPLL